MNDDGSDDAGACKALVLDLLDRYAKLVHASAIEVHSIAAHKDRALLAESARVSALNERNAALRKELEEARAAAPPMDMHVITDDAAARGDIRQAAVHLRGLVRALRGRGNDIVRATIWHADKLEALLK